MRETNNPPVNPVGSENSETPRATYVRYLVLVAACALAIITYLHRTGFSSISSELLSDLDMNQTHAGYMTVAFMLAYGLFEVPWGRLGDKRGARNLLVVVVIGGSLFTAAVAAVTWLPRILALQLSFILMIRFLFGAFQAGTFPLLSRVMADWIPMTERGKAQGLVWMSTRTGAALAPILIVPLFQSMSSWRAPLVLGAFLGVLWCGLVWPWFRSRPEQSRWVGEPERRLIEAGRAAHHGENHRRAPWSAMLRSTNVWALWLMYGFLGFSGNFFLFQFPDYLKATRGFDAETAKWLSVTPFACGIFACVGGGALSDWLTKHLRNKRLGRRLVGCAGLCLAGTTILITPWIQNVPILALLYGLTFLGNDLSMGPAWAAASDIGQRQAGSLAGAMNMMASFMAALAAIMATQSFHGAKLALQRHDLAGQQILLVLPFIVFSISYFLGALCWLRVDVTRPIA